MDGFLKTDSPGMGTSSLLSEQAAMMTWKLFEGVQRILFRCWGTGDAFPSKYTTHPSGSGPGRACCPPG